ncbi:hypothetical protein [Mycobacterium decipiens]|uniref:hypothetical protein n=1 Tax=Mycobacterium decipiens TaxID=1430326 RepID=UPI001055B068|nr:hypothetical protein [Mycobacterium decipiens]
MRVGTSTISPAFLRAAVTADELRDYVKERVAAGKYPRRIWLVDELPQGPTGKVQKRDITVPTSESAH